MTDAQDTDGVLLRAVFEATVDAIIVADSAGTILRANPAAERMFGYDSTALLNRNVSILMPPDVAAAHDGYMQSYLDTGKKRVIGLGRRVTGQRKDGTLITVQISVGTMALRGGTGFVAILHDLTGRVAAEAALARSQRLDALGQMTSGISHDFNNLLTVIIGNLELLEMKGGDQSDPILADALEAAELGADLTSRLMQFARKGALKPEVTNVNAACEDALAMLRRTLGPELTLETHLAVDLPDILVDVAQLQTALLNLALNARDAMDGGGQLSIRTDLVNIDDEYMAQETDVALGQYVRLSVTDSGAGMDPVTQARAFEPFFTTKAPSKGTGLGLAMVHGFMRQSGGHVALYSELGFGTSFSLYFPVSAGAVRTGPMITFPEGPIVRGTGETVLVVEDDEKVRLVSVTRLKELGYRTVTAVDGTAAYRMLAEGAEIDLVFSDVIMPGEVNGLELAKRVAQEFPSVPVLLTSGYSDDVMSDEPEDDWPVRILRKPYRQAELAHAVRTVLNAS